MPFGVVSWSVKGWGVLDGSGYHRREGAVLGVNVGRPIVTDGDGDALFPNYFGEDLLLFSPKAVTHFAMCHFMMLECAGTGILIGHVLLLGELISFVPSAHPTIPLMGMNACFV